MGAFLEAEARVEAFRDPEGTHVGLGSHSKQQVAHRRRRDPSFGLWRAIPRGWGVISKRTTRAPSRHPLGGAPIAGKPTFNRSMSCKLLGTSAASCTSLTALRPFFIRGASVWENQGGIVDV